MIKLNPREQSLLKLLLEFLDYHKLKTTLWIAGGWVRDKILNIETDDIDIISDNYFGDFISEKFY